MSDESPIYDPLAPDPDPVSDPGASDPGTSDYADHDSRGGVSPLWIVGGLVLLALFVAGAWWVFLRPPEDLPPGDAGPADPAVAGEPTTEPTGTAPDDPDAPPAEPRVPLPPLQQSDERVRDEVSSLSGREEWVEWLAPEDLVRRFVASVTNVAEGQSPRAHAAHVAPRAPFTAETVPTEDGEGVLVIDEASYRRYDRLADVFASLDIGASVALYHDFEPLFEEAYAEIGDPRTTFRETLGEAIDRLLAVQVPGSDVELVRHATHYRFADPELEALSPAEKHLLRMGPENAEKVQQKLRFLRSALDL